MTIRKGEDTGNWKRKHQITLCRRGYGPAVRQSTTRPEPQSFEARSPIWTQTCTWPLCTLPLSGAIYGTRPTTPRNLPSCPHKSKIGDAVPNLSNPSAAPCGIPENCPYFTATGCDVTRMLLDPGDVTRASCLKSEETVRDTFFVPKCQLLVIVARHKHYAFTSRDQ